MSPDRIRRTEEVRAVEDLLLGNPVVALLGPRQVGKSTLAREVAESRRGPVHYFDLEDPAVHGRFREPMPVLRPLEGLVVLDEVQRLPEVFPCLRVLADRPGAPARFLVLGSASPDLLRQSSESLAGRISFHDLRGFGIAETGSDMLDRLWLRGGFPRSYLASSEARSAVWRKGFLRTFLERDIPQFGIGIPGPTLRRFWTMVAHYHGQNWNSSEFARSFGVSDVTVRRYLDILTWTFVVDQVQPWAEIVGKRLVKSPRVVVADTGILHALLGLWTRADLDAHPKLGASWESFASACVRRRLGADREECFFWATQAGAELDLLVVRGRRRIGFEIKRTEEPKVTKSMRIALEDLRLDEIAVIHAGEHTYPLGDGIRAVALRRILEDLQPLE